MRRVGQACGLTYDKFSLDQPAGGSQPSGRRPKNCKLQPLSIANPQIAMSGRLARAGPLACNLFTFRWLLSVADFWRENCFPHIP
jgi:hypothetical protein